MIATIVNANRDPTKPPVRADDIDPYAERKDLAVGIDILKVFLKPETWVRKSSK